MTAEHSAGVAKIVQRDSDEFRALFQIGAPFTLKVGHTQRRHHGGHSPTTAVPYYAGCLKLPTLGMSHVTWYHVA